MLRKQRKTLGGYFILLHPVYGLILKLRLFELKSTFFLSKQAINLRF